MQRQSTPEREDSIGMEMKDPENDRLSNVDGGAGSEPAELASKLAENVEEKAGRAFSESGREEKEGESAELEPVPGSMLAPEATGVAVGSPPNTGEEVDNRWGFGSKKSKKKKGRNEGASGLELSPEPALTTEQTGVTAGLAPDHTEELDDEWGFSGKKKKKKKGIAAGSAHLLEPAPGDAEGTKVGWRPHSFVSVPDAGPKPEPAQEDDPWDWGVTFGKKKKKGKKNAVDEEFLVGESALQRDDSAPAPKSEPEPEPAKEDDLWGFAFEGAKKKKKKGKKTVVHNVVDEPVIGEAPSLAGDWGSSSTAGKEKKKGGVEAKEEPKAEEPPPWSVKKSDEKDPWGISQGIKTKKDKKKVTFEGPQELTEEEPRAHGSRPDESHAEDIAALEEAAAAASVTDNSELRDTWSTSAFDFDFDAFREPPIGQNESQEGPSTTSVPSKGKQATVEDVIDTEDDGWSARNPRSAHERPEPPPPGLSKGQDSGSPTPNDHSVVPKHDIDTFRDEERRPRYIEVSPPFTSSGEASDDWDYIDELEPSDNASQSGSPRYERIRHRSLSRTRRGRLDSYDDYPSRSYGRRRRTPTTDSLDDIDDYPGYARQNRRPHRPPVAQSAYENGPNPFAPSSKSYGYPMPGYPPGSHPLQMPYGYAPSPPIYGANYPAYTGMPLPSPPVLPASPPRLPAPPPPPPPPRPPPPPSSHPSEPAPAPPGPANKVYDSEEASLSYGLSRKQKKKPWEWKERRHPRRPVYHYHHHLGVGPQRDPKDPKCHAYNVPFGDHGEPLSIDIKIRGFGREHLLERDLVGRWPWLRADTGQSHPGGEQTKLLSIVGAKRWFDSESHHTLDLTCSSQLSDDQSSTEDTIRWLHVERQRLEFDEFTTLVLGVPHLSQDWKIVLLSLLKRIRKLHYDHSTNRFFPWTLRADSADLGLTGAGDTTLSATAVSFPYFALGSLFGHGPKNTDEQYPIMSLFEWDDRFESAKEWDAEQSFRLMNDAKNSRDSIIYVPHVWAIAFNDTIVTYGQLAFSDLVNDDSIHVIEKDPKAPERATSVEITDLRGQKFALSLNQCRTFFSLKQSIKVRGLVNSLDSFDVVDIVTPNNQTVDGERWLNLLEDRSSSTIRLQLRPKILRYMASAPVKPASRQEDAAVVRLGSSNQIETKTNRALDARRRDDSRDPEDARSESSSDSDSSSNERNQYALALIPRPARPSSRPTFQTSGAVVLYNPATLSTPNVPSSPPPTRKHTTSKVIPMTTALPDSHQRRIELEEKGVVVFDPRAIEFTPEIYAPPSTAIVRFHREEADRIPEESNMPSELRNPPIEAEEGEEGVPKTPTDYKDQDHGSSISIPHFLSWATRQDFTMQETFSEPSIDSIIKILTTVDETLQAVKPSRHGRIYRRSREIEKIELEVEFPSLQSLRRDPTTLTSIGVPGTEETDKQQHPSLVGNASPHDRVRAYLVKRCNIKLRYLYTTLNNFLSLYVPLDSPSASEHLLVKKYWGAFWTIMTAIQSGVQGEPQALTYQSPDWWVVRDPSPLSVLSNRKKPTVSWKECRVCRDSTQYRHIHEAMHHVQLHHFGLPGTDDGVADEETLALWIRSDNQYYADHRLELYTHYISLISDPLQEVCSKGRNIWDGVASDKRSMPSQFMLPKSLVNAFENAVLLLVCAAKSFPLINRSSDPMNQHLVDAAAKIKEDRILLETTGQDLFYIGKRVKEFMSKAEHDIMLMSHTDTDTDTISYDSVGPEYILAAIMASLFNRPLHADEPVDLVYAGFYRRVQRDAMKHPRTRILRKIWRMREELELIASINSQQQELLRHYLRILEPCTFRATTLLRAARFRVEAPFIETQLRNAHSVRLRISDLDSRLEDVSSHVSRMLEIQQENNGNAIIVFTIVTIIFLPLSWATSYLGMNTSDIRDLNQGQWLFWLIALPVTSVVIGIAVLVVLKGETIREFFIRREIARDRKSSASVGISTKRRLSTRATGGSLARKQSTMMVDSHLWRGFRRRQTTVRRDGEV
ncbi:hypothetical protein K458DRAFT_404491 [Lentithecium fluviatile CBS 122367]|uniref:DUF7896 domain-containing protein n=1 Tax=Lentithecium fluviatile CBS 122367 TaxID=1168545 RepID=A0A6G1J126_9PLEO|nr:hypothetical protein K458DRAFT_404491 [Lentithecium fluviatile CBS 122367]